MSSKYGWIITEDYVSDGEDVGVCGPRGISSEMLAKLKAGRAGEPFELYDDDGELYYRGRVILGGCESEFAPLDEFGTPNAGCTEIRINGVRI